MAEDVIEAHEIRLIGPDGSLGATMKAGPNGSVGIQLGKRTRDDGGIFLTVTADGMCSISLTTPDGYSELSLTTHADGQPSLIAFGNADLKPILLIGADQSGSSIFLNDANGERRIGIAVSSGQPSIEMIRQEDSDLTDP